MNMNFHHTGVSVTDLERSISFYRDLLGLRLVWRLDHRKSDLLAQVLGLSHVDVSYAMLEGWGGRLELFQYHSPQGRPNPPDRPVCDIGITHVSFKVEGIEEIYERLVRFGVRFHSPPKEIREGVKVTYMRDPDGIVVELVEYRD